MVNWEFRDPLFLLFAFLAPLVYLLASRSGSVVRYSSLAITDQAPRSVRLRLAKLPAFLLAIAVGILAVALAGPRTPDAETRVSREGIAMMMVVDRSSSMDARDMVKEDYSVDRLTTVKDVFQQFVLGGEETAGRPDDIIGLVAFAGFADSLCPLTLDHGNLAAILSDVRIVERQDEDGTALGDGLALAVERLRRSKARSKVAILLTDGVSNAGAIDPKRAAQLAIEHNIKVYCIGAGTNGRAPYPVRDPLSGRTVLQSMSVEIDEDTLKEIAETTNGQYFRATDKDSLAQIYTEIDRLERTEITETRYLQYTEHYVTLVIAGLSLLAVSAVTNDSVFRTLP